jgi:hypothetical protein
MAITIGQGTGGVLMSSDTAVTGNCTLDTSQNWMSIGPITINSGITVTVNTNAYWTVV